MENVHPVTGRCGILKIKECASLVLLLCLGAPLARATIVGLNQIVTPDIQPTGILSVSAQAEHATLGNSQEIQFELGLTPRLEVAWFQGFKPGEGIFSTELGLLQDGPHLLSVGAINWSTRGSNPQPVLEYGFYKTADHFVAGVIYVSPHSELLLGYRHQVSEKLQLSTDFQSGEGNATTIGFSYNLTDTLSINPALYITHPQPRHLLGYVVLTWNIEAWKPKSSR